MRLPWETPPEVVQDLKFRILKPEDFQLLFEAASDPLIWELHPDKLRHTEAGFRIFFEKALQDNCLTMILSDERNEKVIGSSRFYKYDGASESVFIGFTFLIREYWGGKWNSRIKLAMLSHAFQFCKIAYFEAAEENLRSIAALEKLGARKRETHESGKVLFFIDQSLWPEIRENLILKSA